MSQARLKLMHKLFDEVESLEELTTKLQRPAERELLKRTSILRYFDVNIFNKLRKHLPENDITFVEFVKNIQIESVPRTVDTYAIKEEARNQYLEQLMSERNADSKAWKHEKEVFQKLIIHYEKGGAEFDLDRLVVLTLISPEKVRSELESLYAEADERFDLARCNDLLRTFEIRFRLLPDDLKSFCRNKRQYYNARNLYTADFYQTTTYLPRADMTEGFAQLDTSPTADFKPWIFHIYATGGLGKTMFVRWLISRYCLPEPQRIPVSRLDFDLLDLSYANRYPLLLLLPIADQLNRQIENRPFTEIFSSMWGYKQLLETGTGGAYADRADLEASFKTAEAKWRPIALKEFCRTLHEVSFDKPIMIAIDTFEEMLLLNKDSLVKAIKQVEEMHKAYPALRLILSGRYDLREELTELSSLFENESIHCELKRFTKEEARTYLTERRGLKEAPFIEAIVKKCTDETEGKLNPFILSLMTDLVTAKDIQTVAEIQKYPRAEVAYMIQRIIDRIKDLDVRWMLRYAVIPRTLTLEVLENIMWQHLLKERQERRGKDLVSEDGSFDQTEYWPYGEAATAKEAWDKLKPFVSSYGWVSYESGDPSRLRLHPEVVTPMRFLLAQQEIFPLLHEDAAKYFAKKAETEAKQWAAWMSEAVYHRFQMEGPKAAQFWRQQLNDTKTQTDMEARRRLAFEITKKRDYVDEKGVPLKWPDENSQDGIVTKEDLCDANYEVVVASIMLAAKHKQKTQEYTDEWNQAREHLLKLDALLKSSPPPAFKPPFDVEAYAKLAAELNKSLIDYDRVIPLMETALSSTGGLFLPLGLQIQLAEMYDSIHSEKAGNYFRKARDASRFLRIPFLSPLTIQSKLARWYQQRKHFSQALAEYEAALARPEMVTGSADWRRVNYRIAEVNLEIGRYRSGAEIVQELNQSAGSSPASNERFDHSLLFGYILSRYLYRPQLVLNRMPELLQLADDPKKRAAVTELQGCVLSQLMEFKEAPIVLELAREQWSGVLDPVGADRARMHRLELQLDQIGNVNEAAFLLEGWVQDDKNDAELTTQMELLRVRSLHLQGEEGMAREKWGYLSNGAEFSASARSHVRILSTGFVLGFGAEKTLEDLLRALRRINPPSARLPLLGAFRFAEGTRKPEPMRSEHQALIKLIEWPPEKKETFASILMFADVLRFCQDTDRVKSLLERAITKAVHQKDMFACIRLLSALNRSGVYSLPEADIYTSTFLQDYSGYRNLCYAALLEQAERELETGQLEKCQTTLTNADNYATSEVLSKWRAFAEELTGRLARRRGDQENAAAHLTEASLAYERLGDKHSANRILNALPKKTRMKASQPSAGQEATHSIRLEALDDQIVVTSDSITAGKIVSRRFQRSDLSTQLTASHRDRSDIFNLIATITEDFVGFTQELGKILLSTDEVNHFRMLRTGANRLFDARLELAGPAAKIPWEWATFEGEALLSFFRNFYRGSSNKARDNEAVKWINFAASVLSNTPLNPDPLPAPPIREVLSKLGIPEKLTVWEMYESISEELQEVKAEGQVSVLIIKPSFETQVSTQRGSYAGGFSAEYFYEGPAFNSVSLEVSRPERLAEDLASAIATVKPQLIHIESSFTQNPTTADVYLDFNIQSTADRNFDESSNSVSEYVQLSTPLLNDVLGKLSDSVLRPLVILEGQRAPSLSSTVHQVLLRNTFGSELFRLGNTSGVVATGLFRYPEDRLLLLRPFINRLSSKGSLGSAVMEINSRNIEVKADLDLISCPVLFTDNPLFMLLPTA